VSVAGTHGVAVDALGRDALATTTLDRVVQAEHHRPDRGEGVQQQAEQDMRCCPAAPDCTVEHAVIVDKATLSAQPHDPQQARHRAPAGRQDGTDQQRLGVLPRPLLHKHWRER
jgi:hypothetical protein